jgi:hypothetical protein
MYMRYFTGRDATSQLLRYFVLVFTIYSNLVGVHRFLSWVKSASCVSHLQTIAL